MKLNKRMSGGLEQDYKQISNHPETLEGQDLYEWETKINHVGNLGNTTAAYSRLFKSHWLLQKQYNAKLYFQMTILLR